MADVKVPPLLHKMSATAQKAWYKKHGMEMPTAAAGKSAAQAKKDVGEINKKKAREAAIAAAATSKKNKELVSSSDRVRMMRKNADAFGGGLGGGLDRNRDIINFVRSGGYIKAGRLGEEAIEEGNVATKQKLKNFVRGLGTQAAIRGEVPFDQVHSPLRSGRKVMKNLSSLRLKSMKKEEIEPVVEQDDTMEKKEMAETQLHFIKYAAEEILEFIKMGGEIEEWYQNKLSKVQSEVESLHSYIEGEKRRTGMVEETEEQIDEKYMGFKKLKASIAAKGGARDPAAVAAAIGRKKYGKEKFQAAAAKGKKLGEEAEFVAEAEGKVAVTPKEKDLAAHHGDKTRITYGDVIKARLKSAAAKKMGKQ